MSFAAAIIGLAVLVMIHEAGHFFAARAVGMTPRKFYLGFGPPIVKKSRGGVEYAIGSIPLGGYVKIPGMNRPSPGEFALTLKPELREAHAAQLAELDAAIGESDWPAARAIVEELRPAVGETRGWQELEMALAPDAYWRQTTWRRLVVIGAGPAVNLLFAFLLFLGIFLVSTTVVTRTIGKVVAKSPAAAVHLQHGDRVLRIAGSTFVPDDLAKHIRATRGRPFKLVVLRHGQRVTIGPVRARLESDGIYRIGVSMEARTGPGESLPTASRDAVGLAWDVVSSTVTGLGQLATGKDTRHISSTVGIVRVSAQAWRAGVSSFLQVLGLVSLALGILNLLPVLPLDGGHIVIALVEKIRGRTFRQSVYIRYSAVGLTLFAVLMYFGLRNDLFGGGN
jgi:regulator of sigma E protease